MRERKGEREGRGWFGTTDGRTDGRQELQIRGQRSSSRSTCVRGATAIHPLCRSKGACGMAIVYHVCRCEACWAGSKLIQIEPYPTSGATWGFCPHCPHIFLHMIAID